MALLASFAGASASQAAPGALRILLDENQPEGPALGMEIAAKPGVAVVDSFDSSVATPSQESLASYDLVFNTGDISYDDPALYGDRLANYIDAGGALIQFAYDNWNGAGGHVTGRFESGGYPPFIPGNADNLSVSLGTVLPGSPFLAGVPSFTTTENTTDDLAVGATLLAKWSDDRNAIAVKGQVVSVTAHPESGFLDPLSAAAQLAVNAGNVLGKKPPTPNTPPTSNTGQRAAALKKCKKSFKKTHNKKKFKKCKKKANRLPA